MKFARVLLLPAALSFTAWPAAAQADDVWSSDAAWEAASAYGGALIVAPGADEPVLYRLLLAGKADYVLESGIEIGGELRAGVDADHPSRAGFSGAFAPAGAPGEFAAGGFSGLSRAAAAEGEGPRGRIEAAFVYADTGYGEVRAGIDQGVARRFSEAAPALFRAAGIVNPALDPDGEVIARTDHDLTGPALRISYATPRLLGVRAGLSYAPDADRSGLDRDPARAPLPALSDAFEIGVNVSRRLPRGGPAVRLGAAWSTASASLPGDPGSYNRIETWSVGGLVSGNRRAFGASYLSSDNGLATRDGSYEAWEAGGTVGFGVIEVGLGYAAATDRAAGLKSDGVTFGLAREFGSGWRVAAGWRAMDTRRAGSARLTLPGLRETPSGIVFEITRSALIP